MEVLKQFPFMEFLEIRHIPEGIIWIAIAPQQAMKELKNRKAKRLYIIALPAGLLLTLVDKRRV